MSPKSAVISFEDARSAAASYSAIDLAIVANSYRLVSDDAAFEDLLVAWEKKLAHVGRRMADTGQFDSHSDVADHLQRAREMLADMSTATREDPIEEAVGSTSSAAMVLTPGCLVVRMNTAARTCFSAEPDQINALAWLDPLSESDFEAVRQGAKCRNRYRQGIIRIIDPGGNRRFAEIYVVDQAPGGESFVVVRALEGHWEVEIDVLLRETFGLTAAEGEIARMLYETCSSAQIAEIRRTSALTVRTQIKTILAKTETTSQVDLIRLLGLLLARANRGKRSQERRRRERQPPGISGHGRCAVRHDPAGGRSDLHATLALLSRELDAVSRRRDDRARRRPSRGTQSGLFEWAARSHHQFPAQGRRREHRGSRSLFSIRLWPEQSRRRTEREAG